jgi:hypothetical protein
MGIVVSPRDMADRLFVDGKTGTKKILQNR